MAKKCTAKTKAGKRCRRRPAPGGECCAVHDGGQLDGLTPEVEKMIVDAVRAGAFVEEAAQAAGVSKRTLFRWQQRAQGEDAPERFRRFADAVERARAQANVADVVVIRRAAAQGDWRAAGWRLERIDPRWRRKTGHEVSGPDGGAIPLEHATRLNLRALTEDELDELARLYEKAGRDRG
jgi:transposase